MSYSEQVIGTYYGNNKYVKSNKKGESNPIFNLKVSEKEKDFDWYRDYVNYIVPPDSSSIEDYDELKRNYEIYNDDLSRFKERFREFCDPLGENLGNIDDEIEPFPVMHNKVNVLKGEFLNRNDKYNVILISADAIRSKNERFLEEVKKSINQELSAEISRVQAELEGKTQEEIDEFVESKRAEIQPKDFDFKNYKSELEIFNEKALKYCYYDQNIPIHKLETLEDVIISDRMLVYSGWKFGKPALDIRNPLFTGFQKSPNEKYIHKGDYVWYKKAITVTDAFNNYGHLLDQSEIDRLGLNRTNNLDEGHSIGKKSKYKRSTLNDELFRVIDDYNDGTGPSKDVGSSQGQGLSRQMNDDFLIWETHIEFKAFRNLIFVSYTDDYNNDIVLPLSKEFDIPKDAQKVKYINKWGHESIKYVWMEMEREYTAEELWIPWKYEVVRLGEDVYPIYRAVPHQIPNIENPYTSFNLSTFGRIFTNRNAKSISLLRRALPYYLQLLFVKKIQNRELAKYQGFIQDIDADTIPTELGEDVNGELIKDPIAVWLTYRKKLGLNIYSGSQTVNGMPAPPTRSPGSSAHIIGTASDIFNLQQLAELLNKEIGLAMGVPPQREAQFATNSNATDNRQALQQSYYITEPYFYMVDDIWKEAISDYINNFKTYCKQLIQRGDKNPMFHYVLPDGTQEILNVTESMLHHYDMGLYLDSNVNQQRYNQLMEQYSQAFAQNAGEGVEIISTILKAITEGSSSEETHKLIQIASQKQQQQQERMQQMQSEQQQALLQKQAEMEQTKHDNEMTKIEFEETLKGEYKLKDTQLKINAQMSDTSLNVSAKLAEVKEKAITEREKIQTQTNNK